jgi:hypothetical protein
MKPETWHHSETLKNTKKLVLLLQCCVAVSCVFDALRMIPNFALPVHADKVAAADRPELVLQTGHAMRVDGLAFATHSNSECQH